MLSGAAVAKPPHHILKLYATIPCLTTTNRQLPSLHANRRHLPSLVGPETYIPRTVGTIFPIFSDCQSEQIKHSFEPFRFPLFRFAVPKLLLPCVVDLWYSKHAICNENESWTRFRDEAIVISLRVTFAFLPWILSSTWESRFRSACLYGISILIIYQSCILPLQSA